MLNSKRPKMSGSSCPETSPLTAEETGLSSISANGSSESMTRADQIGQASSLRLDVQVIARGN